MIIKDISRTKSTKNMRMRFKSSIDYSLNLKRSAQTQSKEITNTFTANINYSVNDKADQELKGERVVYSFHANSITSINNAAHEMEVVSRFANCKDPSVHAVFSYDASMMEFSDKDLSDESKRELIQAGIKNDVEAWMINRGYVDAPYNRNQSAESREHNKNAALNQYVAIVHGDTNNLHVHVIVNRVSLSGHIAGSSFTKIINEHTAADIAIDRQWPVVIGKHNRAKALQQAKEWGATKQEIESLATGNYKNLLEVRRDNERKLHLNSAERAAINNGKVTFVDDYSDTIKRIFNDSRNMKEFQEKCFEAGVIVKYSEKGDNKLPVLSFADLYDKDGNSGTKIGVTAKHLTTKFGKSEQSWFDRNKPIEMSSISVSAIGAKPIQKTVVYKASETQSETQLKSIAKLNEQEANAIKLSVSEERKSTRHKLIMTASKMGIFVRSANLRQERHRRLEQQAQSKLYANVSINKALIKLEADRLKLVKQLNSTPEKYDQKRDNLILRIQAVNVKAQYELYRHQFTISKKIQKDRVYKSADKAVKAAKPSSLSKFLIHTTSEIRRARNAYHPAYIARKKREALRHLQVKSWGRKSEINDWKRKTIAEIDQQKPVNYEQWLNQQTKTEDIMVAIKAERAIKDWAEKMNAERLKPTNQTMQQNRSTSFIDKVNAKADEIAKNQAAAAAAQEAALLKQKHEEANKLKLENELKEREKSDALKIKTPETENVETKKQETVNARSTHKKPVGRGGFSR